MISLWCMGHRSPLCFFPQLALVMVLLCNVLFTGHCMICNWRRGSSQRTIPPSGFLRCAHSPESAEVQWYVGSAAPSSPRGSRREQKDRGEQKAVSPQRRHAASVEQRLAAGKSHSEHRPRSAKSRWRPLSAAAAPI